MKKVFECIDSYIRF
nr:hypothetical protein [Alkalihalophilus marmarensis]